MGGAFDRETYLALNPDVAAAGVDPTAHWLQYGQNEGRVGDWTNVFNPQTYLAANPDVAAAGVNPLQHWLQYGVKEGRRGGGFAEATPYNDFGLGNMFSATGNVGQSPGMAPGYGGFDNPAVPTSPQQWYANGGYDPYDPNTYGYGHPTLDQARAMGTPQGAASGGYDPQWGGSSSFPKGMRSEGPLTGTAISTRPRRRRGQPRRRLGGGISAG